MFSGPDGSPTVTTGDSATTLSTTGDVRLPIKGTHALLGHYLHAFCQPLLAAWFYSFLHNIT